MDLAASLKMSLQRCRRETTSSEFVDWKVYNEQKAERKLRHPNRTHFYLAQIAQEVRRVLHKHPKKVKLEQFVIRFDKGGPQPVAAPPSAAEIAARTAASKGAWFAALRITEPK